MRLFKNHRRVRVCEAVPFIYDFARRSRKSDNYKRTYRCMAKHLKGFEDSRGLKLTSNSFSESIAEDFVSYLTEKGLALNTVSGYFDKVCYMFRRMGRSGFDVDYSFECISVDMEEVMSVYITSDEIENIYMMKVTKSQEIIRDRFVANCLTGMRYSDFSKLTSSNIQGGMIVRKTQKTGEQVMVPMHRIVKEIIKKYDGFPPYINSSQNYNKSIKRICRKAGLTDRIMIERTKGGKVIRKTFKRYELVTSHTARRSFATNAYIAGIPTARIMLITGHTTEQSFFKYIRIGKRENAKMLAEHPFFQ